MMKISNISFARGQQGASLIFALMALVVLSLAAVGLVRSVNTGALIAGNLSFKRDTTLSGPAAAEQAIAWLQTQALAGTATLDYDDPTNAYFASAKDDMDPTGTSTSAARPLQVVNWDGNCLGLATSTYSSCDVIPIVGQPVNGNRVQWVITRMCDFAGPMGPNPPPLGNNLCSKPKTQWLTSAPEKGELGQGKRLTPVIATPYYRIITRIEGARNTVSYIETIIHF
jgi:type IV pilus assembly protein PilX